MALGKTIKLYLIDGVAVGPVAAEVLNWTGHLTYIPRANLHELAKREEVWRTGAYILAGLTEDGRRDQIYIGEGDEVFGRLKQHDKAPSMDFWTRAVTITSKDQNLTKAHGRYLESRLIELAAKADKAVLCNGTALSIKSLLPESDRADMEYFLEQVQLVLPVLGFDYLRPTPTPQSADKDTERSPLLVMNEVGASARAYEIGGEFVVQKGSTARKSGSPSWTSYVGFRESLIAQGKLVPHTDELYQFADDVAFQSPSGAAATVAAANRNGRVCWKLETGQTYAEWKEAQLESADEA